MSRLLGKPAHQCFVYPHFDAALEKFAAGGIGPFFVLDEIGGMGDYRGEKHAFSAQVAFVYSGDACFEIIAPKPGGISAYNAFLESNPYGGLHHIAYYSDDFAATLAMMEREGRALEVVVDMRDPATDFQIEIYCEPVGADNPVLYQLMHPGMFDGWFEAMREAAATWDGSDAIRDARPLMMAALEGVGAGA
ncbi:MAG: VOC family protein [Novosphingobium sp.]|nr:VOC family protein [Novosphingobium sp.]